MDIKQNKSIGLTITHTANLLNNSINKKIKPYDIAIEQRAILEIIHTQGEIKQIELCNILEKDKTTISRTLKTLEGKKYIKRIKVDNKTQKFILSELGKKVFEETKSLVDDFRAKIIDIFDDKEIENLYEYLDKISTVIKKNN